MCLQLGGFSSFIIQNFIMKMLSEDEVRLQLGLLRYLDIKVKKIRTCKHFFNCSLEAVKVENLLIC